MKRLLLGVLALAPLAACGPAVVERRPVVGYGYGAAPNYNAAYQAGRRDEIIRDRREDRREDIREWREERRERREDARERRDWQRWN